eukprot:7080987-Alexandrium_andersonii.AAC.1
MSWSWLFRGSAPPPELLLRSCREGSRPPGPPEKRLRHALEALFGGCPEKSAVEALGGGGGGQTHERTSSTKSPNSVSRALGPLVVLGTAASGQGSRTTS